MTTTVDTPTAPPPGIDRLARLVVLVGYPLSRLAILLHGHTSTDIRIYYRWIASVLAGAVPYVDLPIEYPPGAWLFIRAVATSDPAAYFARFRAASAVVEVAAFVLLVALVRRRWPARLWTIGAGYVLCTTALETVLLDRLDVVLLALMLLWAWLRLGAGAEPSDRRRVLSYVVLGLGIAYKVMPVVFVPFVFVHDWRGGWRVRASSVAGLAAGVLLPFAVLWPTAGFAPFLFARAHVGRALEFGTIWADVAWFASAAGVPFHLEVQNSIVQVMSPWAPALARLSTPVSFGSALGVLVWHVRRGPSTGQDAVAAAILALSLAVTTAVVLSPQYFIWLCPLLLVAAARVMSPGEHVGFGLLLAAMAVLTSVVWPARAGAAIAGEPLTWALLTARNGALVAANVWLAWRMVRHTPGGGRP